MKSCVLRYRRLLIALCNASIVAGSLAAAFLLRFDFRLSEANGLLLYQAVGIALPLKMAVFHLGRLHQGWWRYIGAADVLRLFLANAAASAAFAITARVALGPQFPRSVHLIDFLVCFLVSGGVRSALRVYNEALVREASKGERKGVLIYGAGAAGANLLRDLRLNPKLAYRVVGFIDDDPEKRNAALTGVRVLGGGRDIPAIVERHRQRPPEIAEVIIAMPSAAGRQMREAVANCRAAGVGCKTVPGIADLLEGRPAGAGPREISVEDLLGREPLVLDRARIRAALAHRSVLITGAAGSIGSELARQIAAFGPRKLILLDQAESELFRLDLELRSRFPRLDAAPEICDIRNLDATRDVMRAHAVDTVFHAAAYKHVPMMEFHPLAAAENNVIGTWNVAEAARCAGARVFVLVSTDKAINPSSVMGATKRAAELIVSSFPVPVAGETTRFVAVRFGNVLASNGSVVPIFQAQIAAGGPVTVTHPEVRRYFMTIPEATQLVLQASTMGRGSEIYVLDMGQLVRIADLARHMIRMAGFVPDEEIEIRYVGLRPGEKLYEEIIGGGESVVPTRHERIKIFRGMRLPEDFIEEWVSELRAIVRERDEIAAIEHLKRLIPEYEMSEFWTARLFRGAEASA